MPARTSAWLLPAITRFATTAVSIYYRFEVAGEEVPRRGPVLLVANHPNSLVDPAAVITAARRPVHFLAKAPLFEAPGVKWLVAGAGSIPVYLAEDDPARTSGNVEMFAAAHEALASGSAIGIFPEGWSHSEPGITRLKTGAARVALGAARRLEHDFPIIPVGLTFRQKHRFRSEALALVGRPLSWGDLAGRAADDAAAVRELTRRVERGLRGVTVNLESWEDRPLVEAAEEIYAAEFGAGRGPGERVQRLRAVGRTLARLRRNRPEELESLSLGLLRHRELLDTLGLGPDQLGEVPGLGRAAWLSLRRVLFFGLAAPLALLGILFFYIPYKLTGLLELRYRPIYNVQASFRVLVGAALMVAWVLSFVALGWWHEGWRWGVGLLVGLPAIGMITLSVRERWTEAWTNARRYLLLRGRENLRRTLRERQRELAARLEAVRSGRGDRSDRMSE